MHDLGDLVPISFEVRDADGVLVNATTVTLTVTLPDGTPDTPTVTNPPASTGVYAHDFATTQAGRHTWRVETTGPTAVTADTFDVRDGGLIISLRDAKRHLNMSLSRTDDDEELRSFIAAATPVVEDIVGPVIVRSPTEVHSGGPFLVLDHPPVLSVTTVAAVLTGGTSYAVADLDVDADTGIVRRLDGGSFVGPLRVTYQAGRRVIAANILHGTAEVVRHMWDTQRGHVGARPGFGDEEFVTTGSGFTVPRRVIELLAPHRRAPLVA